MNRYLKIILNCFVLCFSTMAIAQYNEQGPGSNCPCIPYNPNPGPTQQQIQNYAEVLHGSPESNRAISNFNNYIDRNMSNINNTPRYGRTSGSYYSGGGGYSSGGGSYYSGGGGYSSGGGGYSSGGGGYSSAVGFGYFVGVGNPNPSDDTDPNSEKKPCKSADGKKANPLNNMKILPTPGDISRGGKPVNGDYKGRGGKHNGVDLAAEPGTPIYAPYDGKITGNIVTTWPDDMGDLTWREFRDNRKESNLDSNSGGNRFRLEVEVDGQMYHIQFMHIQEGGAIHARNTEVKAGDLIGYTGATGSVQAPGSGGPHLHIEYWINGQYKNYANPKDFFFSEFDELGSTTNPCD